MTVPILKLGDVLLTSLQTEMTDDEAVEFQREILARLVATEAKGAVIDITAMDLVDSYLARVINDTANMAGLIGVQVVLCGMQPAVALTLTEMGRGLIGVTTALDLEQGLQKLRAKIAEQHW